MTRPAQDRSGEEGFLLLGLVVACFLILLVLGVAAPRVAKELERDREVESEHRALEYVRAIQLFYRRNNAYPTTVEQLLGAGTAGAAVGGPGQVKYLRQKYKDPLTNDEFRLIRVNEAQTKVKGFFGEPLQGMAQGLGALAGSATNPGGGATAPTGVFSSGFSASSPPTGGSAAAGGSATAPGVPATAPGASTSGTGTGSSTDATTFQGSKGAFMGVGSSGKGHGQVEWNGSEDIAQWEFLYDPRVEQLKAKVSIFGGTPAGSGSGSLGSGFAPASGLGAPGSSTGTPVTGGIGLSGAGTSTPATPVQ